VKRRIILGVFTGLCFKDRMLHRNRIADPPHRQVNWSDTKVLRSGTQRATGVAVVCPDCGDKHYAKRSSILPRIERGRFSARCRRCLGRPPVTAGAA
jgi:hypothetical protein